MIKSFVTTSIKIVNIYMTNNINIYSQYLHTTHIINLIIVNIYKATIQKWSILCINNVNIINIYMQ